MEGMKILSFINGGKRVAIPFASILYVSEDGILLYNGVFIPIEKSEFDDIVHQLKEEEVNNDLS